MKHGGVVHPFYPRDLDFPDYVPNERSVLQLMTTFFGALGVCLVGLWILMGFRRHLNGRFLCKLKISWFLLCGLIHLILEGYFAAFYRTIAQDSAFLAECWKEYGRADSRYISGDSFTVCMESVTAFVDGPLAFLAVYAFMSNKPYRHVVQLVLSLFQLYGDVLYFATEAKEGFTHGPLWHPLYFWLYFVVFNAVWIIVPMACIVESYKELTSAQSVMDRKNPDGNAKKRS